MKYIECPNEWQGAGQDLGLFLGGGISSCPLWQDEIVPKMTHLDITLINPRRKQWDITNKSLEREQIEWEHRHMLRADAIMFWFPCETLCPITLYELGKWSVRPKQLFVGCHPDYQRKRDVEIQTELERPKQIVVYSLNDLISQVETWLNNSRRVMSQLCNTST